MLIKEFLINLQKYIKKVETILINIQSFIKTPSCSGDYNNFIEQIVNSVDSRNPSNMHQYFSLLITKSSKENNKEIKYYQNSLAKYVMDYLVILITIINDSGKKIYFNKDILLNKFYKVFGEENNTIEISTIDLKERKSQYLIVSFLPILFKIREAEFSNLLKGLKDRQSINGYIKYYPSLMKTINEFEKK